MLKYIQRQLLFHKCKADKQKSGGLVLVYGISHRSKVRLLFSRTLVFKTSLIYRSTIKEKDLHLSCHSQFLTHLDFLIRKLIGPWNLNFS